MRQKVKGAKDLYTCSYYHPWNKHIHYTKLGAWLCGLWNIPKSMRKVGHLVVGKSFHKALEVRSKSNGKAEG